MGSYIPTPEMPNQGPRAKSPLLLTSRGLKLVEQEAPGVLSTPHPLDNGQDLESREGRGGKLFLTGEQCKVRFRGKCVHGIIRGGEGDRPE